MKSSGVSTRPTWCVLRRKNVNAHGKSLGAYTRQQNIQDTVLHIHHPRPLINKTEAHIPIRTRQNYANHRRFRRVCYLCFLTWPFGVVVQFAGVLIGLRQAPVVERNRSVPKESARCGDAGKPQTHEFDTKTLLGEQRDLDEEHLNKNTSHSFGDSLRVDSHPLHTFPFSLHVHVLRGSHLKMSDSVDNRNIYERQGGEEGSSPPRAHGRGRFSAARRRLCLSHFAPSSRCRHEAPGTVGH